MRKHKQHSKSAGGLDGPAPLRLRQPGYGAHPALAKKVDRLSDELQQTGSWVVNGSDQDKPPLEPVTAWGTVKLKPESPSGAVLKSWPKWAKPGFLDELPPRLEGCRQRLLAAERELRRAEAGGALNVSQSAVPAQGAARALEEPIVVEAPQLPVDTVFEDIADPVKEEEELLAQLSSLEHQMSELDGNWEGVAGDHTAIRGKRNDFSDRLQKSQARETNLKWRLATAGSQLETRREEIQSLREQLGVSEGSSEELNKQLVNARDQVAKLQNEVATARAAAEEFRDNFMASEEEQKQLRERIADLEETNESLRSESANRIDELEEERRQVEETLHNERNSNEVALQRLAQETNELLQKLAQENERFQKLTQENERLQKLAQDNDEHIQKVTREKDDHLQKLSQKDEHLQKLAQEKEDHLQKMTDDLDAAKNEAQTAKSEALQAQESVAIALLQHAKLAERPQTREADAQTVGPPLEDNAAQTLSNDSGDTVGSADAAGIGASVDAGSAAASVAATGATAATAPSDAQTNSALPEEEGAAQTATPVAQSVMQAAMAAQEQQWVDAWENTSDALNLAAVPPLIMASGLAAAGDSESLLCPARCRLDLDLLEMILQPLRPAGPLERIPLSKLEGIDYFEAEESLGEPGSMVVQLEAWSGQKLQLLAGDEAATEALFAALRRGDRTMPGGLLVA